MTLTIMSHDCLTLKHREMHGYVVSTVAIDAMVLNHQAISIINADLYWTSFIYENITLMMENIRK